MILVLTAPAHLVHGLVQRHPLDRLAVEVGDDIAGQNPGTRRRGIVDRGDHLDGAVLLGDLDAEAAELAARLHLHVAVALGVHVARMRIEPGEHAVDRRLDQLGVVGLVDIVDAHALEDVAEQVDRVVGVGRRGGVGARTRAERGQRRLRDHQRQRGPRRAAEKNQKSLPHHPRTFALSGVAHHGFGSTGAPSLRNSI